MPKQTLVYIFVVSIVVITLILIAWITHLTKKEIQEIKKKDKKGNVLKKFVLKETKNGIERVKYYLRLWTRSNIDITTEYGKWEIVFQEVSKEQYEIIKFGELYNRGEIIKESKTVEFKGKNYFVDYLGSYVYYDIKDDDIEAFISDPFPSKKDINGVGLKRW